MKELIHKEIFRLSYGIGGREVAYKVGQDNLKIKGRAITITEIMKDEESYREWGSQVYFVKGKDAEGNEYYVDTLENMPVSIGFAAED